MSELPCGQHGVKYILGLLKGVVVSSGQRRREAHTKKPKPRACVVSTVFANAFFWMDLARFRNICQDFFQDPLD